MFTRRSRSRRHTGVYGTLKVLGWAILHPLSLQRTQIRRGTSSTFPQEPVFPPFFYRMFVATLRCPQRDRGWQDEGTCGCCVGTGVAAGRSGLCLCPGRFPSCSPWKHLPAECQHHPADLWAKWPADKPTFGSLSAANSLNTRHGMLALPAAPAPRSSQKAEPTFSLLNTSNPPLVGL